MYKLVMLDINKKGEEWSKWDSLAITCIIIYTTVSLAQESIQMSYAGRSYITDMSNIVEASKIVLNSIFIGIKLSDYELNNTTFALALACLTMIKFLIQLRVFDSLGMLVLLIFKCVYDTLPFINYLVIWIIFFVSLMQILGANLGQPISGVGVYYSNYISMFRTSVGDVQEPAFECPVGKNCVMTFL